MPRPLACRPTPEQFGTALLWLRSNDGGEYEAGACATVADWIEALEYEAMLRREARKAGVTYAQLRRKIDEAPR